MKPNTDHSINNLTFHFLKSLGFSMILILILSIQINFLHATTRYVSPLGNDHNSGTREKPILTIQWGLDQTFAGDTLLVMEGGYNIDQPIRIKNTGKYGKWITLMAEPEKNVVIAGSKYLLDWNNTHRRELYNVGILHIEGVRYIKVEGFTVYDSHVAGIMVRGTTGIDTLNATLKSTSNTSNIEISRCKTLFSWNSGIGLWYSDSVKVTQCEIVGANFQDIRPRGLPARREAPHEALTISGCKYFEVAYNYLHNCIKEGIDCKEFSSHGSIHHNYCRDIFREGIYVDSWFGLLTNVDIYSNIVHDCDWGVMINAEGKGSRMKNIRVYDNLIYNTYNSGIQLQVIGSDCPREDIYIFNNTVVNCGIHGHWCGRNGGIDLRSRNVSNLFVFNNLLAHNGCFELGTYCPDDSIDFYFKTKGLHFENNMISNFHDFPGGVGAFGIAGYALKGIGYFTGNPDFENIKLKKFKLNSNSDAIGKSKKLFGYGRTGNLGADIDQLPDLNIFK